MKKTILFAGLLPAAAAFMMTGCTAELKENRTEEAVSKGTPVTLYVEDKEWLPEDGTSRSVYEPGVVIHLTGTENIGLFYWNTVTSKLVGSESNYSIKAEPSGAGIYTFTNPGAAEDAPWYSVMPYSKNCIRTYSSGNPTQLQFRVGPTQYPEANSFDPMADILIGKPFTTADGTGTITAFKRMTAPFKLNVTGLEDNEKIYAITLELEGDPANKDNSITGQFIVTPSDEYDGMSISSVSSAAKGRKISAIYGTGLTKSGDGWPVWLAVKPITVAAGTNITLTVTTADATYTRTASLPAEKTFVNDKVNTLTFNIKGSGVSSCETLFQDFTKQAVSTGNISLKASNGTIYNWTLNSANQWTAASSDGNSGMPNALNLPKNSSLTIPSFAGKVIKNVRLFLHPCASITSGTGGASLSTISLKDGNETLSTIGNAALVTVEPKKGGYWNGGIIDIGLPDGYTDLSGLTLAVAVNNVVASAMLFTTASSGYNPYDYYARFLNGEDLTIGGTVYNKNTHTYGLFSIQGTNHAAFTNAIADKDIMFLDYDENNASPYTLTLTSNMVLGGKAIVGRYANHQPVIDGVTGTKGLKPTGDMAFKNVGFYVKGSFLTSENLTANASLAFEDCSVEHTTEHAFIFENNPTYDFCNLYFKNSVLLQPASGYGLFAIGSKTKTAVSLSYNTFEIENNVFVCTSSPSTPASGRLINLYVTASDEITYVECPSLHINFSHNTVYNRRGQCINVKSPEQATLEYNALKTECSKTTGWYIIAIQARGALDPSTSTSRYNWGLNTEETGAFGISDMVKDSRDFFTVTGNQWKKTKDGAADIFQNTANPSIGYLPIDPTVVTNGAGATYSTKLWRTWE